MLKFKVENITSEFSLYKTKVTPPNAIRHHHELVIQAPVQYL